MPKKAKEKKTLEESLKKKIKELSALYEVGKSITSTLHLDEVLKLITKKSAKIMDASSSSLRLLGKSKEELVLKCAYGFDNSSFKIKKNLKVGESIAGRVVKEGKAYIINDLQKERHYKYPHLVKQKGLRSLVTVPLSQGHRIVGVLSVYNKRLFKYGEEDVRLLSMFASQATIAIENARLYEQAEKSYLNTIKTLSNIIDAKDSHTYGHSERVMKHCIDVADALKLPQHEKDILKYSSLLHDIGKIGIDVGILRKPSRLNDEEWNIMVMHPVLGSGIVEQISFLNDLAPIILRHHERYDGKGYPGKLKKEEIPLGARILAVVDAYESMVSDRPYRKSLSVKKAKHEILKCAGTQFDPHIAKVFLKTLTKKKRKR
ncbi:MAG: GAF domain-containing protein [Candidatus Omnitrophica bacterium]|nr:GAF domain-containing protein [Candidatus Omnitrophota bacterium]MBU4589364.1 GAF domain-containing protein [Candidatus Omnitrophota bacterium]